MFIVIAAVIASVFLFIKKDPQVRLDFIDPAAMVLEADPITEIQNKPYFYFQRGWLREPRGFAMILPKGTIRFFALNKEDRRLNLLISKGKALLAFPVIDVLLGVNGRHVDTLRIRPGENKYEVVIKKELMREGSNYLELNLDRGIELQRDPKSKYYLTEYLCVRRFQLQGYYKTCGFDFSAGERRDRIVQPPQSRFELYLQPAGNEILHYAFVKKRGIRRSGRANRLKIKIRENEGPEKAIAVFPLQNPTAKGKGTIRLQPFRGKNLRIVFEYVSGEPDSKLEWRDLFLANAKVAETRHAPAGKIAAKPHIFLIIIDAARHDYFGFSGFAKDISPNIDQFARCSFDFRNFYAQAPYTAASVATMLSGLYPEAHTVRDTHDLYPEKIRSLTWYLKKAGYKNHALTGNIVLINNNLVGDFDSIVYVRERKKIANSTEMNMGKIKSCLSNADFSTPQFFYIHLLPPHEPYNPPAPFNERFIATKRYQHIVNLHAVKKINEYLNPNIDFVNFLKLAYQNNVSYADFLVGEIIRLLKERKIYQDAIMIVTSDHGEAFFEHEKIGHNTTNYNDMIKVPFLLKMPQQEKNVEIAQNFGLIDLAPTLLELLGLRQQERMQGSGFSSLLLGLAPSHNENMLYSRASSTQHNISLIYREFKYINYFGREELYNLREDPDERVNVLEYEAFMAGFLRQKAFEQMAKNIELRNKLKISGKKDENKKRFNEELKTLGYL
ncbi:MAG: sulfatase [Candidatus Aminicenantes bacterium]|nr:sulfatase [Candidatus Aminicenantes bacterium]